MSKRQEDERIRLAVDNCLRKDLAQIPEMPEDFQADPLSLHDLKSRMSGGRSRYKALGRMGRMAAMLALALLGSFLITMAVSSRVRAEVGRILKEFWEDRIVILFQGEPEKAYVLPDIEAGWLPASFTPVLSEKGESGAVRLYQNPSGTAYLYLSWQVVREGSSIHVMGLNPSLSTLWQRGEQIIELYEMDRGQHYACWLADGERIFVQLQGQISRDELLRFVENLQIIEE